MKVPTNRMFFGSFGEWTWPLTMNALSVAEAPLSCYEVYIRPADGLVGKEMRCRLKPTSLHDHLERSAPRTRLRDLRPWNQPHQRLADSL